MFLNLNLTPHTNINLKWILDLKVKHKTKKLREKKGKSLVFRSKQRVLRFDNKSSIHKKKN